MSGEPTLFGELKDPEIAWDLPDPFTIDLVVGTSDIDQYGHTNNAVYLSWCDRVAWAHTTAVGLGIDEYRKLDRAMAVRRSEVHHLAPCFAGDRIRIGNWIVSDTAPRSRALRRYQITRLNDGKTLVRALSEFVCIELSTGRPKRLPDVFKERYRIKPNVAKALLDQPSPFSMEAKEAS